MTSAPLVTAASCLALALVAGAVLLGGSGAEAALAASAALVQLVLTVRLGTAFVSASAAGHEVRALVAGLVLVAVQVGALAVVGLLLRAVPAHLVALAWGSWPLSAVVALAVGALHEADARNVHPSEAAC